MRIANFYRATQHDHDKQLVEGTRDLRCADEGTDSSREVLSCVVGGPA
jgi:hypothetical protein